MERAEVKKSLEWTRTKKRQRDHVSDDLREYSDQRKDGEGISTNLQEDFENDRWKMLPEELVETILAMVPFPYVFKARVLSKSWLTRLSSISSQDDEEKKRLAVSFQKKIRQWSTNWKTFCPVQFRENNLIAYDRASHSWLRLRHFPFLHEKWPSCMARHMEGALLVWTSGNMVYVANILTPECKQLPPRPDVLHGEYWKRMFVSHTLETYKVIIWTEVFKNRHSFIYVYDSASTSWRKTKLSSSVTSAANAVEYLDGFLYFVVHSWTSNPELTSIKVVALNIKEETLVEEPIFVAESTKEYVENACPVICNANLLFVILDIREGSSFLWKIDLGRKQSLGMSQGPPNYLPTIYMHPVSDGDYVFTQLRLERDTGSLLAYNVHADQRDLLPYLMGSDHLRDCEEREDWVNWVDCWEKRGGYWISSSFRPSLNPFVTV